MSDFTIRTAQRHEMTILKGWATELGWNPGNDDYDTFFDTDPQGYFLGFLGDTLIGSVSGVKYGESYGYIGFYIVKAEYRGKGYGLKLFNHALKYLEGRNIGLDGVVEQQHNYRKSGFTAFYNNVRYQGVGCSGVAVNISRVTSVGFDQVWTFDTVHYGTDRATFLKGWLVSRDIQTLGIIEDGVLKGYGCIRPAASGYRIGPLFADDKEVAGELLTALRATVSQETPVYIDIPDVNETGVRMLVESGFKPIVTFGRMHTKACPSIPLDHIYASTSAELG